MENSPRLRALGLTLAFLVASSARATTLDPLPWEQLVIKSDLLAVIECETAGELVASYRIVESWKGPQAGERVRLRLAPDTWGPLAPSTLVGERFLVAAFKEPPSNIAATSSGGGGHPLWWRDLKPDYGLPLLQGLEELPPRRGLFGSSAGTVEELHTQAQTLLSLPRTEQLARLIEVLVRKELSVSDNADGTLLAAVRMARTHEASVMALLAWERAKGGRAMWQVNYILHQALDAPEELSRLPKAQRTPGVEVLLRSAAEARRTTPEKKPRAPSTKERTALRQALQANGDGWDKAFNTLTVHECGTVAQWLIQWTPSVEEEKWHTGYGLGSWWAWRCGTDRATQLAKVADGAKSPWVRVAAAVYLAYEDEAAARQRLVPLMKEPGFPGVWAALTLARRGDKSAMPRLLEASHVSLTSASMDDLLLQTFQKRVAVLLSNSAKASGLPAPPLPSQAEWDPSYSDALEAWWKQHAEKLTLADPWLPQLQAQRVD